MDPMMSESENDNDDDGVKYDNYPDVVTISLADSDYGDSPCFYSVLHPYNRSEYDLRRGEHPCVVEQGFFTNYLLTVYRLLLPAGQRYRFETVKDYEFDQMHPNWTSETVNVYRGASQMTGPYQAMEERANFTSSMFIGPITVDRVCVAHRMGLFGQRHNMNLWMLYPEMYVWRVLSTQLTIFCLSLARRWMLKRLRLIHQPSHQSGLPSSGTDLNERNSSSLISRSPRGPSSNGIIGWILGEKTVRNALLAPYIFATIDLILLRSHVVKYFNTPLKDVRMDTMSDLADVLATGKVRAVVESQFYLNEILNPVRHQNHSLLQKRFVDISRYNPPLLTNWTHAMSLVKQPESSYIFVVEEASQTDVKHELCQVVINILKFSPVVFSGIHTSLIPKPLWNQGMFSTIRQIKRHIDVVMEPIDCAMKHAEANRLQPDPLSQLELHNINGIFVTIAVMHAVAVLIFLFERWSNQFSVHFHRWLQREFLDMVIGGSDTMI